MFVVNCDCNLHTKIQIILHRGYNLITSSAFNFARYERFIIYQHLITRIISRLTKLKIESFAQHQQVKYCLMTITLHLSENLMECDRMSCCNCTLRLISYSILYYTFNKHSGSKSTSKYSFICDNHFSVFHQIR